MEKIKSWWTEYRRLILFMTLIVLSVYALWMLLGKVLILAVCAFAIWYARKYREDLAKTEWQDWINPVKWASVLFGAFTKMLFPMHIVEQLILRMYDKECIRCTRAGTCFACGCDSSKMYVPWEECFRGNWGAMFEDAKEYRDHRSQFPIEIDVRHLTEEDHGPGILEWLNRAREQGYDKFTDEELRTGELNVKVGSETHVGTGGPVDDKSIQDFIDSCEYEFNYGVKFNPGVWNAPDQIPALEKIYWKPISNTEVERLGGAELLIKEGMLRKINYQLLIVAKYEGDIDKSTNEWRDATMDEIKGLGGVSLLSKYGFIRRVFDSEHRDIEIIE